MVRARAVSVVVLILLLTACTDQAQPQLAPVPSGSLRLPAGTRALFFGDSWTQGISADPGRGFPYVVAGALGWEALFGPNGAGDGFVNVNPGAPDQRVLPQLAASAPKQDADVIVVEGGLNDVGLDLDGLEPAVVSTVKALRVAAGGDIPVVLVGPPALAFPESASVQQVDAAMARAARQTGAFYVSPLRERWFSEVMARMMIDPASGHPTNAGHAYFGGRLAEAIARLEH